MNSFVLDASIALAWFVDQPIPDLAIRVRRSLLLEQATAVVPSYWHLEVANVLVVAERRGVTSARDTDTFVAYLEGLLISAIESRQETNAVRASLESARQHQLSPYDAVYLALAQEEGIALATLDQKLRAAATRAGVDVIR